MRTVGCLLFLPALGAAGLGAAPGGTVVDGLTTFLCRFDEGPIADFSAGSPHPEGVTALSQGHSGRALLARNGILPFEETVSPFFHGVEYETEGNLNLVKGTIEMWVQPLFDARTSPEDGQKLRYLFSSGKYVGELHGCALLFQRGGSAEKPHNLVWLRQNGAKKVWSVAWPAPWELGSWHHVAATYSAKEDVLYADGKAVGRFSAGEAMDLLEATFAIGSSIYNSHIADCLIDDLRLSGKVRTTGDFAP